MDPDDPTDAVYLDEEDAYYEDEADEQEEAAADDGQSSTTHFPDLDVILASSSQVQQQQQQRSSQASQQINPRTLQRIAPKPTATSASAAKIAKLTTLVTTTAAAAGAGAAATSPAAVGGSNVRGSAQFVYQPKPPNGRPATIRLQSAAAGSGASASPVSIASNPTPISGNIQLIKSRDGNSFIQVQKPTSALAAATSAASGSAPTRLLATTVAAANPSPSGTSLLVVTNSAGQRMVLGSTATGALQATIAPADRPIAVASAPTFAAPIAAAAITTTTTATTSTPLSINISPRTAAAVLGPNSAAATTGTRKSAGGVTTRTMTISEAQRLGLLTPEKLAELIAQSRAQKLAKARAEQQQASRARSEIDFQNQLRIQKQQRAELALAKKPASASVSAPSASVAALANVSALVTSATQSRPVQIATKLATPPPPPPSQIGGGARPKTTATVVAATTSSGQPTTVRQTLPKMMASRPLTIATMAGATAAAKTVPIASGLTIRPVASTASDSTGDRERAKSPETAIPQLPATSITLSAPATSAVKVVSAAAAATAAAAPPPPPAGQKITIQTADGSKKHVLLPPNLYKMAQQGQIKAVNIAGKGVQYLRINTSGGMVAPPLLAAGVKIAQQPTTTVTAVSGLATLTASNGKVLATNSKMVAPTATKGKTLVATGTGTLQLGDTTVRAVQRVGPTATISVVSNQTQASTPESGAAKETPPQAVATEAGASTQPLSPKAAETRVMIFPVKRKADDGQEAESPSPAVIQQRSANSSLNNSLSIPKPTATGLTITASSGSSQVTAKPKLQPPTIGGAPRPATQEGNGPTATHQPAAAASAKPEATAGGGKQQTVLLNRQLKPEVLVDPHTLLNITASGGAASSTAVGHRNGVQQQQQQQPLASTSAAASVTTFQFGSPRKPAKRATPTQSEADCSDDDADADGGDWVDTVTATMVVDPQHQLLSPSGAAAAASSSSSAASRRVYPNSPISSKFPGAFKLGRAMRGGRRGPQPLLPHGRAPISSDGLTESEPEAAAAATTAIYAAAEPPLPPRRKQCNCTRSQCLKMYCDCFANGEFCRDCNCKNCFNTMDREEERKAAIKTCLDRNTEAFKPKIGQGKSLRRHNKGCNCKRSGCLKNYCECYEAKIQCTEICKCVGCHNMDDSVRLDPLDVLEQSAEIDSTSAELPAGGAAAANRSIGDIGDDPLSAARHRSYKTTQHEVDLADLERLQRARSESPDIPAKKPCNFLTQDVIEATIQCVIAQATECLELNVEPKNAERMILEEFGRCLVEIIDFSVQSQQDEEE